MRRFFLFLIFVICFLCAGFLKQDFVSQVCKFLGCGEHEIYVMTQDGECGQEDFLYTDNALKKCSSNLSAYAFMRYGETYTTQNCGFDIKIFMKEMGAEMKFQDEVCDRVVYGLYTKDLSRYVLIDGKKINLQISVSDEDVRVGYPMIVGSF